MDWLDEIEARAQAATPETWVDIDGYGGKYQISDHGNVRSFAWSGARKGAGAKEMKQRMDHRGYLRILLRKDGKVCGHKVHRLVLEHFAPMVSGKHMVNHIDGNKTNNHISNLEWVTSKENLIHAYRTGLRDVSNISIPVEQIDRSGVMVRRFSSAMDAQRVTGINNSGINKCCQMKAKKAGGYGWKYASKQVNFPFKGARV